MCAAVKTVQNCEPAFFVGEVARNDLIARDTFRMSVRCPELAGRILPSQFVMVRVPHRLDPLLARPFALYDVSEDRSEFEFVYLILGSGTRCLSGLRAGASVEVWGPLGNRFPTDVGGPLLFVAGGVGQTPFLAVAKELLGLAAYGPSSSKSAPLLSPPSIAMAYGVRTREYFAGLDDFRAANVDLLLATNDGSGGRRGYVTDLVEELLQSTSSRPAALFGCGPEPMLARLSEIAALADVPCWVSLESKMACGYGVCFSCVCPIREGSGWDYRRTCVEGPVFRSERLAWSVGRL
jgi:dihydroorotate dehydrogenase electron transfer subunit